MFGCSPFAADHHVVPRLIPEVVVVRSCPSRASQRPTTSNSVIEQQEPAGAFAFASPSIEIMIVPSAGSGPCAGRRGSSCLAISSPAIILCSSELRGSSGVDDVNVARRETGHDQVAPLPARRGNCCRRSSRSDAVRRRRWASEVGDDLTIGFRVRIDVDRRQVVRIRRLRCRRESPAQRRTVRGAISWHPRRSRRCGSQAPCCRRPTARRGGLASTPVAATVLKNSRRFISQAPS